MGANNTKGLYLCETIYPPDNGVSCIPPEKLEKAIKKGEIYEAGWGPRPWGWEPDTA